MGEAVTVVVVPRFRLGGDVLDGVPTSGREKLGVCDLAGAVGDTGSTPSFPAALFVFNGLIMPSCEFLFSDLMGGSGEIPAVFVFVAVVGEGLVPRRFGELRSSERGGMGRPPVVLGLVGTAGNSFSVRGGGIVPLFCGWRGVAAGGANWDCTC